MLLWSRRGERDAQRGVEGKLPAEGRAASVPAPGHLGSPPPPLPTGEEWKLVPGRAAMASGASAPCGARGAVPASLPPILKTRSAGAASTPARSPDLGPPCRGRRRPAPRGPCHPGAARRPPAWSPRPGPRRASTPGPSSHLSSRCRAEPGPVPASALLLRRRRSSSRRRRHRVLHPRRSHMEQPSQPWRSREPGSAAPRADGAPHARPLPDGVSPRASPAPPPDKTLPEPPLSAQHPLPRLPPPPPSSLPPPPHLSH